LSAAFKSALGATSGEKDICGRTSAGRLTIAAVDDEERGHKPND